LSAILFFGVLAPTTTVHSHKSLINDVKPVHSLQINLGSEIAELAISYKYSKDVKPLPVSE